LVSPFLTGIEPMPPRSDTAFRSARPRQKPYTSDETLTRRVSTRVVRFEPFFSMLFSRFFGVSRASLSRKVFFSGAFLFGGLAV
jgi:hypothetical protein